MYTSFADFYDRLTHDIHYARWADYLQSAFRKSWKDPKLILELGWNRESCYRAVKKRFMI